MSSAITTNFPPLAPELFRRTCARFATGIAVLSTMTPDGVPHGLTVNSFTSVSCAPPIISVCIDLNCSVLPVLANASHFAVNVLAENQREISMRFASACDARFDGIEWNPGKTGVPQLAGVLACLECRRHSSLDVGDHMILLGEVESAEFHEGWPLLYFNSRYCHLAR